MRVEHRMSLALGCSCLEEMVCTCIVIQQARRLYLMKVLLAICVASYLSGCTAPAKYVALPVDQRIHVTKAYSMPAHREGDEFVFSLTLPPQDQWRYPSNSRMQRKGYLDVYAPNLKKELMIEWIWIDINAHGGVNVFPADPIYLPWYTGKTGTGERVPYVPTERQLSSGDWYRVGYPQKQFHQALWVGKDKIYCVRSLFRTGGRTTWDQQHGVPEGAGYSFHVTCPFRFMDGRNAYFKISTGYGITADELKMNPDINEEKLAFIDAMLQPI